LEALFSIQKRESAYTKTYITGADLVNGRDMGGVNPIIFCKKLEVSRHQIAI